MADVVTEMSPPVYGGQQSAVSVSLPAPVGGWNTRDPLAAMPPLDAIRMENWFPDTESIRVRSGHEEHATGLGSGTIAALFSHVAADGTETLVACANTAIYDATAAGSATSLWASGITTNQWHGVQFRHNLVLCNGVDQPLKFDGSSVSTAAYTGISDDSVLILPTSYKSRLYFVEKDKGSYWYMDAVDTITGAMTEEDISSLMQRGGYISAITTWNFDAGDGINSYFVIVTNMGEIFVYTGPNPADSEWKLVMHGNVGRPLGRNCFLRLSAELFIITDQGVVPLSQLFSQTQRGTFETLSDKINPTFREAAELYRDNAGWQAINYPEGKYALFNIPVSGAQFDQYITNTVTGSWTKFTGWNGASWALLSDDLFFGGTDGIVYKAATGHDDDGASIPVKVKTAFSYYGDKVRQKRFGLGRPIFTANGNVTVLFDIDADFEDAVLTRTVNVIGSLGPAWDAVAWDTSSWGQSDVINKDWYRVAGIGRAAAVRIEGEAKDLDLSLSAIDMTFTPGGLL